MNHHTVLLLDNPGGSALVEILDSHFNVLASNTFAETGWTAIKVASGGDGLLASLARVSGCPARALRVRGAFPSEGFVRWPQGRISGLPGRKVPSNPANPC
ncbi:MAG: hypothetical protein JO112_12365 [Planctomycetes bacterium]|nr:hypothetical protein [Planctomycetota bacterium]